MPPLALEPRAEPCPEWAASGMCRRWGCPLAHDAAVASAAIQRARTRLPPPSALALPSSSGGPRATPLADERGPTTLHERVQHSREQRARLFAAWLVEKFSAERLRAGTGVLDIAGGRGDVAVHLIVDYSIPATLIDPQLRSVSAGQLEKASGVPLPPQIAAYFNTAWLDADGANSVHLRDCSALIGLHPDEATVAIVDVALKLRKPFAVLPCCVFREQFRDRRLPSGAPVEAYDDLVAFICAKDPAVRTATLEFFGRNQVLYWDPPVGTPLPTVN